MPYSDPEMQRAKVRRYHHRYRDKELARSRRYHAENAVRISERKRARHAELKFARLARKYHTTPEALVAMREAQDNACALCRRVTTLLIDHDHDTSRVRGWLCRACNGALGILGDNAGGVMSALVYLTNANRRHQAQEGADGVLA